MDQKSSGEGSGSPDNNQAIKLNEEQIQKYLEERWKRFPKRESIRIKNEQDQANKKLGVLQNDISNQPAIKYETLINRRTGEAQVAKQAPSILDYFLRESQRRDNSLILEALKFVVQNNFLQGDIPPAFLYDFGVFREAISAPPPAENGDQYSYTYSYTYTSSSSSSFPSQDYYDSSEPSGGSNSTF